MKKVLELCVYVAILIAVIIYNLTGGGAEKPSQSASAPPESTFSMPDPEPRQGQPLEGVVAHTISAEIVGDFTSFRHGAPYGGTSSPVAPLRPPAGIRAKDDAACWEVELC